MLFGDRVNCEEVIRSIPDGQMLQGIHFVQQNYILIKNTLAVNSRKLCMNMFTLFVKKWHLFLCLTDSLILKARQLDPEWCSRHIHDFFKSHLPKTQKARFKIRQAL